MTGREGVGGSTASRQAEIRDWRDEALCANWPDLDWVSSTDPDLGEVCTRCPVRTPCAEYALRLEEHGERPSGWWAGVFLTAPGTKDFRAADRRHLIADLRQLAG